MHEEFSLKLPNGGYGVFLYGFDRFTESTLVYSDVTLDGVRLATGYTFGTVTMDVCLRDDAPVLTRALDVADHSFVAAERVSLGAHVPSPDDPVLPLTPGTDYRMRYTVTDIDEPHSLYRLDLWPAPRAEAVVLRDASLRSRRGRVSDSARDAAGRVLLQSLPTEQARLHAFTALIFTLEPEVILDLLRGEPDYLDSVRRAAELLLDGWVFGRTTPLERQRWLTRYLERRARAEFDTLGDRTTPKENP